MSTVHEVCSCGARFEFTTNGAYSCMTAVEQWREQHRHEPPNPEPEPDAAERHDTVLDALVERADHRDTNPKAELDHRTRMGFRP